MVKPNDQQRLNKPVVLNFLTFHPFYRATPC